MYKPINHIRSTNTGYTRDGSYQVVYPPQPSCGSQKCSSNITYDTLPTGYPMRKTVLGPTTLKHQYRGPRNYPLQTMNVPVNTLYGENGGAKVDPYGNVVSYGTKLYPFTHRSPKEVSTYSPVVTDLPAIEKWTRYSTLSDGAWGR